jgi:hypothetical protein
MSTPSTRKEHDVGGDLRRDAFPDFERTLPVGARFRNRNGGEVVLLSVDVWSDRIVVNFAYEATTHPLISADGYPRFGVDWTATDDRGTSYRWQAGGAGGGDDFRYGYAQFTPAPPEAARRLFISSPDLREPIEVALAP